MNDYELRKIVHKSSVQPCSILWACIAYVKNAVCAKLPLLGVITDIEQIHDVQPKLQQIVSTPIISESRNCKMADSPSYY